MRPIDADALLKDINENYDLNYGETLIDPCRFAELVEAAPTIEQPTWISVKYGLPIESVAIEMFFPVSQSICLGYYKEIKKVPFWCVKFPDGTGRLGDEKPTHWRYRYIVDAPQPPKGVE